MGVKLFIWNPDWNEVVLKMGYVKMHDFHGNPYMILENGEVGLQIQSILGFYLSYSTNIGVKLKLLVILYVNSLNFLWFFLSFLKFSLIFINMQIRWFTYLTTGKKTCVKALIWHQF